MKIEGLGALVTGGASGLGEATARLLADRGADVALLDLPRSKGTDVAKEIGANTLFLPADVTSEEQVAAAIDRAIEDDTFDTHRRQRRFDLLVESDEIARRLAETP